MKNKCSWCRKEILEGKRKTIHDTCAKKKWDFYYGKENKKKYYEQNKERLNLINKEWRKNNKELIKELHKNWVARNRNKKKLHNKKWYKNNLELSKKYSNDYKKRNPNRTKVGNMTRKINTKSSCEICGSINNLQKHHWRYDKPLEVNTLCIDCHKIQHIKNFYKSVFGRITC